MLLAHDLGTTGDKASLHRDDGSLVASWTAEYDTDYRPGGRVEQDPHALVGRALRRDPAAARQTDTRAGASTRCRSPAR